MSAILKANIDRVQMKIQKLRAKHSRWNPIDAKTMEGWEKMLAELRQQVQFIEHPVMKKWITYCQKTVAEINSILLDAKELAPEERRILMEKRNMMKETLGIFVPKEKVVDLLEHEADTNMHESGRSYPHPREFHGATSRDLL